MADLVEDLMSFTGLGRDEAVTLLEASNFDLNAAATLHFEQQESRSGWAGSASEHERRLEAEDSLNLDPEVRADHIEQAAAATRARDEAGNEERGYFDAYPRIRYCLALIWRMPGVPLLHSWFIKLGRLLYSFVISDFTSLLLAPLQLLGLVPMENYTPSGATAIQQLQAKFEDDFGTTHPTFYRGTCQQALTSSRQQAKFLLACLYAPGARSCPVSRPAHSSYQALVPFRWLPAT